MCTFNLARLFGSLNGTGISPVSCAQLVAAVNTIIAAVMYFVSFISLNR